MVKRKFVKTQVELARECGVSRRTITDWATRPGFPKRGVRGYSVQKVKKWRQAWLDTEEDSLFGSASSSPWLERYREEKTLLLRMEREERQQNLIARSEVEAGLGIFSSYIRQGIESLQRDFGREAYGIMKEAIDQAVEECERRFGPIGVHPGGNAVGRDLGASPAG